MFATKRLWPSQSQSTSLLVNLAPLGVGGWEELCMMLESGAPAYSTAGAGEGGKQSETSGTGVREGEGVKDGAWSSRGFPTTLCPLPIFATIGPPMILGQNKPRSFHFALFSSLFLVVLLLRTGRLGGLTLKRWETGRLCGVGECPHGRKGHARV